MCVLRGGGGICVCWDSTRALCPTQTEGLMSGALVLICMSSSWDIPGVSPAVSAESPGTLCTLRGQREPGTPLLP